MRIFACGYDRVAEDSSGRSCRDLIKFFVRIFYIIEMHCEHGAEVCACGEAADDDSIVYTEIVAS